MRKPLFIAREPKWNVYVDTDDEAIALIIVMEQRHRAGQIQTVGWAKKPSFSDTMVCRHAYWIGAWAR
jgi:hypothetical protein